MLELRSSLAVSAVTAAVGLSIAVATPAVAAGTAASAAAPSAKKAAPKKKAAKKTTKTAAATPKTVTACVNKKSGATKVLLGAKAKKKCAKGWTKMTWNVAGPAGRNGANGTNGVNGVNGTNGTNGANGSVSVRDATGKRIGGFGGYLSLGISVSLMQVIADDGGLYTYLDATGTLFPISMFMGGAGGSPLFRNAACTGPAYVASGSAVVGEEAEMLANSSVRMVYRPFTGLSLASIGPARAWKLSTALSVVPGGSPAFYELDPLGGCDVADDAPDSGDYLMQLTEVVPPSDGVGPLRVG